MTWETLYKNCIPSQLKHFSQVTSIFLGYNMNIDLIKHLRSKDINEFKGTTFFPHLFKSLEQGKSMEVIITKEEYEWLKTLKYEDKCIGGQAGIMANLFALFPIKEVVVYSPAFCSKQAQFLSPSENLKVPDVTGDLKRPHDLKIDKEPEYHFIFEFKRGLKIFGIIVPMDNRFIASPPTTSSEKVCDDIFKRKYEYAIISGFQLAQNTNPLQISKKHVDFLRKHANVHYEFASIQNPEIRKAVANYVKGFDSIGVNKFELNDLLQICGENPVHSITDIWEGLNVIKNHLQLKRIHSHHMGIYITVVDKPATPDKTRDAHLYAALMAAVQAKKGSLDNSTDAGSGFETPVSTSGLNMLSELALYFDSPEFKRSGIYEDDETYTVAVPTRVVKNPVRTVGLGDVISGLTFVGDNLDQNYCSTMDT